jgi:hypothetical protein
MSMRITLNKARKEEFVHAFMHHYSSPGIGIKEKKKVYNSTFEITELRSSYKVTIKGITKRFHSLCFLAEHIFDNCFDVRYIYWPPLSPYQIKKSLEFKRRADELKRTYC